MPRRASNSPWSGFLIAASVATLKEFPEFNSSLDGDDLVIKRYYNIGFAADTPGGLVVPVIRNADQKGILDIARELSDLSSRAREGKLGMADMQGGTFTISSLGGIGGTSFTPIINAPEVAILGATRATHQAGLERERVRPAADGAALAVLRPPGDRRRGRGALRGPPGPRALRPAQGPAVSEQLEVRVPDIGDFTDVPVIEIHVAIGDQVAAEDPLVTLESDKATMDVPAPRAGIVKQLRVALGDRVSEGSVLLTLDGDSGSAAEPEPELARAEPEQERDEPAAARAAADRRQRCPGGRARRRPRRLHGGLSCRRSGTQDGSHRALPPTRRRLSERGLHPL